MLPLHTQAKLRSAHFARLESFHCRSDVRNSANFWNCCSKPIALVVSAEILVGTQAIHNQQQMALQRLNI